MWSRSGLFLAGLFLPAFAGRLFLPARVASYSVYLALFGLYRPPFVVRDFGLRFCGALWGGVLRGPLSVLGAIAASGRAQTQELRLIATRSSCCTQIPQDERERWPSNRCSWPGELHFGHGAR